MSFGLPDHIIDAVNAVFKMFPQVEKAILYGSRAKGTYENGSDIGPGFIGTDIDIATLYKIEDKLDDLLLPYTFDISILSNIDNKNLLDHIDRVGKLFYIKNINH